MCCTRLTGNRGRKNDAKIAICAASHKFVRLNLRNKGVYRQSEKNLLNSNRPISSTCARNMANFGLLATEIGLGVWGTSANFSGFHVLPSLLQRRRSPEANQTLRDVWLSPGLLHYIYIFGGLPTDGISPRAICTLRPSLAFSYIGSVTTRHSTSGVSQTLRRGTRNGITELSQRARPILPGRPSLWHWPTF